MHTVFDCPAEDDANGAASVFGINSVLGVGPAFLTRWKIGKLSTGFQFVDGPLYGLDVSAVFAGGASVVLKSSTQKCCSGNGK